MTASRAPIASTDQAVTSAAQEGLWFLDRLMPRSPLFNVCRLYRVTGRVHLPALAAAWRAVTARHEILRSPLVEVAGRPVPRVTPEAGSAALIDLGGATPAEVAVTARRLSAELAADPLNLAAGPLTRLTIMRLNTHEHLVLVVAHRAVADDSSMTILVDELSACYAASVAGRGHQAGSQLPGRRQYADYARWEQAQLGTPGYRRLLEWWTRALTPPPPPLTLPFERTPGLAPIAGQLRFDWGGSLVAGVHHVGQQVGAAPSAVLLTAFCALLRRYSGEDRAAVAVPVTVRPPGFEGVIGPFGNLIVLCADFACAPTFLELAGRVQAVAREAHRHRGLPFSHLVRALRIDRDPGRMPWCEAMFAGPGPAKAAELPGAGAARLPLRPRLSAADLALTVDKVEPSIQGALTYRAGLAEPLAAAGLLEALRTLLAAAVANPRTPVDALPLERPAARRAAARGADRVSAAVPADAVPELVRRRAAERPGATAVAAESGIISYRELVATAEVIASHLTRLGGALRAPAAVRMTPGPRQIAASLGVLLAGAQLTWFGPSDTGQRGRAILGQLRPTCMLVDGEPDNGGLADWYRRECGGQVLDVAALPRPAGGAPPAGDAPHAGHRMATADAARAEQRRRAGPGRHRACADQLSGALPGRRVPVDHEPGNSLGRIAYVAYTSGSTGTPKGIAQSHGAFAQFVTWLAGEFGIGPSSRVAQWVAPEHDPSLCEAYAALCAGATLCTVPARIRLHPEKLVDWLADERITFLQTIPSFARELLKVIVSRPGQARLAALDHLVLMGEALPGDLANGLRAALPSVRLANVYGPTETIAAAWHEITDQVTGTVPVGRPIPGRHLLVLDDQDRPCPAGVTGQIVIRSPYVAAGYIGGDGADSNTDSNTDSSAGSSAGSDTGSNAGGGAGGGAGGRAGRGDDSFRPVRGTVGDLRCYRTGDLGRWRWDGLLEFRGRRDLQVKVAGTRVELAAVAAALASHACVGECAVVPLADPDGLVTHLIAYLVLHRAPAAEPAGLREMLRAHLRRHFGTSLRQLSFHVLGHPLPRTAGGKVDRRRLPDPRTVLSRADRPPRTPAERGLAQIWSQLLGTGPAAADETFFAAGGHSLLVPQLIDRVRERFGVTIQIRDCLAHPSLAGLSRLIEAAGAGAPPGAPPDPADAEAAAMQITQ